MQVVSSVKKMSKASELAVKERFVSVILIKRGKSVRSESTLVLETVIFFLLDQSVSHHA